MDYTIKAGDNLTNIAKANKTDVATLAKLNNISNTNLIKTGATLKLPGQQTQTVTPLTATPPTAPNVNANTIGQVNPISLPTTPAPVTPTPQLSVADKAIADIMATQNTASQNAQEDIIGKKLQAVMGLTGETQAKADELAKLGYQQKLQDYQNLNSQILQKQAEVNQSDIQLVADMRGQENRDTLLPFAQMGQQKLSGDAAIMRALKNSEIGVLNAQVLAKQGDIQLAQQTAQDAVDLKYAPYKEQIKQYDMMLETIQPLLSADEKKQAAVQSIKSQVAMKQIDALSKFQSDAIANALSNNAPQSVLNKINSATSISDITAVGGNYLISKADKLDQQLKSLQIAKASQDLGAGGGNLNKLLSISEAKDAGVPYGTTQGELIAMGKGGITKQNQAQIEQAQNKLQLINDIKNNTGGLRGVIGPNALARTGLLNFNAFTGVEGDFIAGVNQLTNQSTLDALIGLKAQGGTLGALSEQEGKMLKESASKIGSWAQTDKNGNVTGYKTTEASFKKELNNIQNLTEKALEKAGGTTPVSKDTFWNNVDAVLSGTDNVYQQAGYDIGFKK